MDKYRITSESDSELKKTTFQIERKKWNGWRIIRVYENNYSNILSFPSFEEAMSYVVKNYCRSNGSIYQPYPNELHYEPYYQSF